MQTRKPLSPGCGDVNGINPPTQTCCLRTESLKNFSSYACIIIFATHMYLFWVLCQLMSFDTLVHCTSDLCWMNTLGRAIEQLAECLAKQSTSQQFRSTVSNWVNLAYICKCSDSLNANASNSLSNTLNDLSNAWNDLCRPNMHISTLIY